MARKPSFTKTAGLIFRCVITSLYEGLSVRPYIHISIFWSIRCSTSHHLRSSHYGSNLSKIDSCELRLWTSLVHGHYCTCEQGCVLRGVEQSQAEQSKVECSAVEQNGVQQRERFEWPNDFFCLWGFFGHFRIMEKGKKKTTNCQTWV